MQSSTYCCFTSPSKTRCTSSSCRSRPSNGATRRVKSMTKRRAACQFPTWPFQAMEVIPYSLRCSAVVAVPSPSNTVMNIFELESSIRLFLASWSKAACALENTSGHSRIECYVNFLCFIPLSPPLMWSTHEGMSPLIMNISQCPIILFDFLLVYALLTPACRIHVCTHIAHKARPAKEAAMQSPTRLWSMCQIGHLEQEHLGTSNALECRVA